MADQTLSPFDVIELSNLFLRKYNEKYQKNSNMFENVNDKDPTSTNDQMELFYSYMHEYQDLLNQKREYVDVYGPDDNISGDNHEVYALINTKNKKVIYISRAYISLLYVAYKTIDDKTDWNIVNL